MRFHWMILAAFATSGCSALFNVDDYEVGGGQDELDASVSDAGEPPDSGPFDAGPLDAGDPDGGPADAGEPDGGPDDAGQPDSGPADAGPSCPPTHRCVAQPEAPWMGPSETMDLDRNCGGLAPRHLLDLYGSLQAPASTCDCSCNGTPTVMCRDGMHLIGYHGENCTNGAGATGLLPNQCYSNILSASLSLRYLQEPLASCAQGTVQQSIPEARWAESVRFCEGTVRERACEDPSQICVPAPSSGSERLCVVAPGELSCPRGFEVGTIMYTDMDDTRACPATCSCRAHESRCGVEVDRYLSSTSCQGATTSSVRLIAGASLTCLGNTSLIRSIRPRNYTVVDSGYCAPRETRLAVTGAARPIGAHTVCCTEQ